MDEDITFADYSEDFWQSDLDDSADPWVGEGEVFLSQWD